MRRDPRSTWSHDVTQLICTRPGACQEHCNWYRPHEALCTPRPRTWQSGINTCSALRRRMSDFPIGWASSFSKFILGDSRSPQRHFSSQPDWCSCGPAGRICRIERGELRLEARLKLRSRHFRLQPEPRRVRGDPAKLSGRRSCSRHYSRLVLTEFDPADPHSIEQGSQLARTREYSPLATFGADQAHASSLMCGSAIVRRISASAAMSIATQETAAVFGLEREGIRRIRLDAAGWR